PRDQNNFEACWVRRCARRYCGVRSRQIKQAIRGVTPVPRYLSSDHDPLFWTATDLELKLLSFRDYYNGYRCHAGLNGETPIIKSASRSASLKSYRWLRHCRGLYQTPMAA